MRNTANRLAALLIVLGAASLTANATADSLYDAGITFSIDANASSSKDVMLNIYDEDSVGAGVDLKKAQFILTSAQDRLALVGKNESGARVKYQIVDAKGHKIYTGQVRNNGEVKSLFDFQEVEGQDVTFKFFIDGELIKEQLVSL